MSGFVVVFQRNPHSPIDERHSALVPAMMERLSHRGPDGQRVVTFPACTLGHLHFWTTPEEVGEEQPLSAAEGNLSIVFDGRLDNRDQLIAGLNLERGEARTLSDAALVLRAYERWQENVCERLLGPFALVIYDRQRHQLLCGRDAMGDAPLYYAILADVILVASEPHALLAHPAVDRTVDEVTLAFHYAVSVPAQGRTFYTGVREVLPAHVMICRQESVQTRRYWEARSTPIHYRHDEEYAEHFRTLLEEAVRCCLRTTAPLGSSLSGGLDSSSVTALAAMQQSANGGALASFSWVFDELRTCDEREYITHTVQKFDLDAHYIVCDDAWTLRGMANHGFANGGFPEYNPYRSLKDRLYMRVQSEGKRVLLTGSFGDHLYSGSQDWLADLAADGRWKMAWQGVTNMVQRHGLGRFLASQSVRRVGRRIANRIPGATHLFPYAKSAPAEWLTPFAKELLLEESETTYRNYRHVIQAEIALGATATYFCVQENTAAQSYQIELRHPYRDRRLIEFVLGLPSYQLFNGDWHKTILRNAMVGILPEPIRQRRIPTSLHPLYVRGMFERELPTVQKVLNSVDGQWRRFVEPTWFATSMTGKPAPGNDARASVLPWVVVALELWHQHWPARTQILERVATPLDYGESASYANRNNITSFYSASPIDARVA